MSEFRIGDYQGIPSSELVGNIVEGLISHVEGKYFWLQRDSDRVAALSLLPGGKSGSAVFDLTPSGTSVLGWWSDAWYRGVVVDNKEDLLVLHFIDYGNTACLGRDMVRILEDSEKKLQPLAVKCMLDSKVEVGYWEERAKVNQYQLKIRCTNLVDNVFMMKEISNMDHDIESVQEDLTSLQTFLNATKEGIELSAQLLEDGRRRRSERRKEILLKEMKIVLSSLGEMDKRVMTNIKGEVFDYIRALDKVGMEVGQSLEKCDNISNDDVNQMSDIKSVLQKVKEKVDLLDLDIFTFNLNMSVDVLPGSMAQAFERINDAIFLHSPVLNPKHFLLDLPDGESQSNVHTNVLTQPSNPCGTYFEIRIHLTHNPTSTKADAFSEFLLQRMYLKVHLSAAGDELDGMGSSLENVSILAKMRKGQAEMMDPSRYGHCLLVRIKRPINAMVTVSVRLLETNIVNSPLVAKFHGENVANVTSNDTIVTVNMSDLKGLDESDLASLDMTTRRKMFSHHGIDDLSPASPIVSRIPITCFKESTVKGLLNNTTPFSPRSEGVVSTMKATSVNHQLVSALACHNFPDQFETVSLEEEDSIIAPSQTTSTAEEMQRSLSSDDSGSNNEIKKTVVSMLDKSVTFHPRTEICQFMATPQVKDKSSRYTLEEGQTKNIDGVAGVQKMKLYTQEQDRSNVAGENCLLEEDDPHMMLNASKAPTSDTTFCWGDLADWNKEDNDEKTEGTFNPNRSLMPDVCQTDSSLDHSVWEVDNQTETDNFDIRLRNLEFSEVYKAQHWTRHSNRGFTAPCSMAYLPQIHKMLIAEPQYNRIGVYEATKMSFKAWLHCPGFGQGFSFNYPTSVLCLFNKQVVILEKNKLHFLNPNVEENQPAIVGRFHGLAEDPEGGVWTLTEDADLKIFARRFTKDSSGKYRKSRNIELKEMQSFSNWSSQSKCRFLAVADMKIYITDMGLHKIYTLDLNTGRQCTIGYFGSQEGQLHSPTGILVDEVGNLLVADNNNDRLAMFTGDGIFIRIVEVSKDLKLRAPYGLMRLGDSVFVVFMGREEPGAVTRLKLQGGCEEEGEMDTARPLE